MKNLQELFKEEFEPENPIIEELTTATDLLNLADTLEKFLECIQKDTNPQKLLDEVENEIRVQENFISLISRNQNPYFILEEEMATINYLYHIWPYGHVPKDSILLLKNSIDYINANIAIPQGNRLSEKKIHQLMHHLEIKFGFCHRLFKTNQLRIAIIDNSFEHINSVYTSSFLTNNSIVHSIFLSHERKDFGHPQEYTLLHELGHVIHTAITRKKATPPRSFRLIQEKMFVKSLHYPPEQTVEIFADCFTCVASLETELEAGNPLSNIHPGDKELLVKYFKELFDSIKADD